MWLLSDISSYQSSLINQALKISLHRPNECAVSNGVNFPDIYTLRDINRVSPEYMRQVIGSFETRQFYFMLTSVLFVLHLFARAFHKRLLGTDCTVHSFTTFIGFSCTMSCIATISHIVRK